jgi:hypothetical protein
VEAEFDDDPEYRLEQQLSDGSVLVRDMTGAHEYLVMRCVGHLPLHRLAACVRHTCLVANALISS